MVKPVHFSQLPADAQAAFSVQFDEEGFVDVFIPVHRTSSGVPYVEVDGHRVLVVLEGDPPRAKLV